MYYFLYGEGWAHSQEAMLERGLTMAQYMEFARLRDSVLLQFTQQREILFAGKPFQPPENYLRNAELDLEGESGNYNMIDGVVNNTPPARPDLTDGQTYEEIKGYVDRMRHGEADVLWPGKVRWYAKSSGTTNDKSKFIPVSKDGLHGIHYKGGTDAVALYLREKSRKPLLLGQRTDSGRKPQPQLQCQGQSGGRPFCHPDPEHQSAGELHPRTEQGNRASVRI